MSVVFNGGCSLWPKTKIVRRNLPKRTFSQTIFEAFKQQTEINVCIEHEKNLGPYINS